MIGGNVIGGSGGNVIGGSVTVVVVSGGNVRIETCRAFAEEEYRRIVAGLPAVK